MPLDRAHVTRASRIMLPTYVVFFGMVGLNYLTTSRDTLLATPALAYVDRVMSLRAWGLLFLAAALLMVAALATRRRLLYRFALRLCALSMLLFTGATVAAACFSNATPFGWAYPALVVAACAASDWSLATREV